MLSSAGDGKGGQFEDKESVLGAGIRSCAGGGGLHHSWTGQPYIASIDLRNPRGNLFKERGEKNFLTL